MSYGFTSGFAKDLEDMIALKATFGFSEATYLDRAKDFDGTAPAATRMLTG